jgi:hypothetical protein
MGGGYVYVTYRPEALCSAARSTVELTLETLGVRNDDDGSDSLAIYRPRGRAAVSFRVDERRTPHVRHRHKYLCVPLDPLHQFVFRSPGGGEISTAATVEEFAEQLQNVTVESIEHHVANGDFSRWAFGALQDRDLGALVAGAENDVNARVATDVAQFRARLVKDLRRRYLDS